MTKIKWTQETWDPVIGCAKISDVDRLLFQLQQQGIGHHEDENFYKEKEIENEKA